MKRILASFGIATAILVGGVVGVGILGGGAEVYAESYEVKGGVEKVYAAEGVSVADNNSTSSTNVCNDASISAELKKVAGCEDFKQGDKKTAVPIALNIINVALTLVGLVAVGVIVYGGILYAISTGDAAKMNKGKVCILYGLVGLVVALMSYAIVAFVNSGVLKK